MRFTITKGDPTKDELVAIEFALSLHKREELIPVIRRSLFSTPQLRKPLNDTFRFGRRGN